MSYPLPGPRQAPVTTVLVALNVVVYVIQVLVGEKWNFAMQQYFGLSRLGLAEGHWWQLLTHEFLHGNLLHILLNMCALWFSGIQVERMYGTMRFLLIYFAGGIIGGIAQIMLSGGPPYSVLLGASGSVCAVLLAFTTTIPNARITALLFFILPVRLKAKYLGWGLMVVSLLFWLLGLDRQIGHMAHLGGAVTGLLLALVWRPEPSRDFVPMGSFRRVTPPPLPNPPVIRPMPTAVDAVLEKIVREGIHSLTEDERRLLELARSRMLNRPR